MKLSIISSTAHILDTQTFERLTLMTEAGEITVLPGHEDILSVVRPGILHVEYMQDGTLQTEEYATGGGVIQISNEGVVVVVDSVEGADGLSDLEYIEAQKKEAEAYIKAYRAEHKEDMHAKRLIELEYEFLKYTAMHELHRRIHHPAGGRK